jgi:hypothetical protein
MKHLVVIVALAAAALAAHGELFSFSAITANDMNGCAQSTGESQLYMDVTSLGTGQASLVFTNAGPEASAISGIYFDFIPELSLSLATINNGYGVDFQTSPVKPKNLPGGQDLDPVFICDLSVGAKGPGPLKGINPYESLELIMNYDASYDLLSALGSEYLRVGLHAQSFSGGYSESFINVLSDPHGIPEPGTIPLLLAGGLILRRLQIGRSRG